MEWSRISHKDMMRESDDKHSLRHAHAEMNSAFAIPFKICGLAMTVLH